MAGSNYRCVWAANKMKQSPHCFEEIATLALTFSITNLRDYRNSLAYAKSRFRPYIKIMIKHLPKACGCKLRF
jgi:hypothetical protein